MKKKIFTLLGLAFLAISTTAQEFDVSLYGYVGVNAMMDTRASVTARNRHVYLYPLPSDPGDNGEDMNKRGQFDIDAAHSRFGLNISGPKLGDFKTSAILEGDFVGGGNGDIDSYFRLRHAFVTFSKENWSLLAGQTWHPVFATENFPATLNVNAGTPYSPFIRNPQLRLAWQASQTTQLLFYLVDQNNFRSSGFGYNSTEEAMMPEVDAKIKWQSGGAWAALTAGYKTLAIPRSISPVSSPEKVSAFHFNGSFRYLLPKFTFKMGGTYGGNLSEMVLLGGIGQTVPDEAYKTLETAAFWTDIHTNSTEGWQPGVFAGYTANMGASEEVVVVEELSRSAGKVASVYGISPRLKYIIGKAWIGAEWLFTAAEWGETLDAFGVPTETENYVNHRLLLSLRYNF